jgi:hypothetical protein
MFNPNVYVLYLLSVPVLVGLWKTALVRSSMFVPRHMAALWAAWHRNKILYSINMKENAPYCIILYFILNEFEFNTQNGRVLHTR